MLAFSLHRLGHAMRVAQARGTVGPAGTSNVAETAKPPDDGSRPRLRRFRI